MFNTIPVVGNTAVLARIYSLEPTQAVGLVQISYDEGSVRLGGDRHSSSALSCSFSEAAKAGQLFDNRRGHPQLCPEPRGKLQLEHSVGRRYECSACLLSLPAGAALPLLVTHLLLPS